RSKVLIYPRDHAIRRVESGQYRFGGMMAGVGEWEVGVMWRGVLVVGFQFSVLRIQASDC
ncbi:MAG: hypothetical protein U9N87_08930, partial [Planctomycetota bacterium]|nr:hypothetical protein [Planctomycetota bacterium]